MGLRSFLRQLRSPRRRTARLDPPVQLAPPAC
jgi:hypothetical protein